MKMCKCSKYYNTYYKTYTVVTRVVEKKIMYGFSKYYNTYTVVPRVVEKNVWVSESSQSTAFAF